MRARRRARKSFFGENFCLTKALHFGIKLRAASACLRFSSSPFNLTKKHAIHIENGNAYQDSRNLFKLYAFIPSVCVCVEPTNEKGLNSLFFTNTHVHACVIYLFTLFQHRPRSRCSLMSTNIWV